ncbi:hypothetical protein [Flavobacterium sp. UBA7682]|uniref:hypothetical protein n=1 Tax=Flavobacterium sp. UBA7682 TaxID=1946560 RepID=UPI0025C62830|nr:hypothetical protein [Flavobacterium sp. UBA7682]
MEKLFQELLSANTAKEVTDVLETLIDDYSVDWTPVGGYKDNIATINIGTDPAAGLAERLTNAIDAVMELEWKIQGEPNNINSPRMASQTWFDLEEGRLKNVENASDKKIQELAKKIKVTLRDSERENYPTVEIRDQGIGVKGDDFSKTILSLHGQNKISKLFLMGAYGQGGSTALSYNNYTIIISKPALGEENVKDEISWTIVRINPGNVDSDKLEWFEYCINKSTGQPFNLKDSKGIFNHGTLIRHIGMDLGKYTAKITGPTSSLWYLAHHYLFDPVIPITISGERKKDLNNGKVENRSIFGNNRRLSKGGGDEKNLTQYQNEVNLTFKDGKVRIYYWVLTLEGSDKPMDRIKNYCLPSQPIIITFNGQKQGTLPSSIIKGDLKLPFIEKYLVVQIECDGLDNESKRHLFSSTRESLRDTSILEELKKLTIDTLKEDDQLKLLDKERKDRYLKKDVTESLDKLRKKLANRINVYFKANGGGTEVKASETKESVKTKKQVPIPFSDPPTFLEITTEKGKEIYIGKTFSIKFKTDAHPSYFNNPDAFLAVIEPHSFGSFTGSARVIDGYGIAYFKCREDVEPGTKGNITLELRPPKQKTLSSNLEVQAIELAADGDSKKGGDKNIPNIQIHNINEDEAYYKESGWNYDTVADVDISNDSVDIFINDSNKHLTKIITRAQQYSMEAVESIKNRYREHVGFCAFMISQNKIETRLNNEDGHQISQENIDAIKRADLANACETIVELINDFFQVIITENVENDN